MPTRNYKPEQMVTILRQMEMQMANGKTAPQACNPFPPPKLVSQLRCCLITTADSRRNPGVRAFRKWIRNKA